MLLILIFRGFITPSLLALTSFGIFGVLYFNFCYYCLWLRITDEGSIPEMRIWSILLIKSDLKWCIHLSRSLYIVYKIQSKRRIFFYLVA